MVSEYFNLSHGMIYVCELIEDLRKSIRSHIPHLLRLEDGNAAAIVKLAKHSK